jgi:enoyl-CoA hydratase/carnithine racemase
LGVDTFNYAALGRALPRCADGSADYSNEAVRDSAGRVTLRIFESLKPVIGAINGAAVGVGITMTLAMDFRVAANTAKIGFVFTRRGIVPEGASSWFLPRLVGISRALEWSMTGRIMNAAEAYEGGLVRSLHESGELLPAAYALAHEIVDNTAPVSVALTRQMFWRSLGQAHPMEAHRIDSRGVYARGASKDAAEGVTSFLSKRSPVYSDAVSTDMPDFFPWWTNPPYE